MAAKRQRGPDPRRPVRIVGVLLVAGLLSGAAISWRLWLTDRDFPHLPCFPAFGPWPSPWDAFLAGGAALALAGWAIRPRWRGLLAAGLGLAVVLALQDQVRWQPWFYLDYEFQPPKRGWDRFSPAEVRAMTRFPEPRRKFRAGRPGT